MSLRGRRHGGSPFAGKLVFSTMCGADDQFSSPKQIRWSAALGKLLVANGGTPCCDHVRNADLSFYTKFKQLPDGSASCYAIDSDISNVYTGIFSTLYKTSPNALNVSLASLAIAGLRMIDASGDPDYIYVTSNNAADGHGVRKVRKSDMTVVASLLATGAGDGQFNNPAGVKYYGGYVYVADSTNLRIVQLDASDLSFVANFAITTYGAFDLDTDGTNWFLYSSSNNVLLKRGMDFSAVSVYQSNGSFYSLCIIPDQGDGNGATVACSGSANSSLKRFRCADITVQVGSTIGSAGDGSASLFDPAATCVGGGTWYTDDGRSYFAASGAAPSQNGFTGIFWASAGPHRVTFKPVGGLAAVTGLNCLSDLVSGQIKNLGKTRQSGVFAAYDNPSMILNLADCATWTVTTFWAHAVLLLPPVIIGTLSQIPSTVTDLRLNNSTIIGALSDLSSSTLTAWLFATGITPGSIGHLTAIRDIRIYSMWPTMSAADSVDIVINSMWTARAAYTHVSGPVMQMGGTNPDPSGNIVAPIEGTDWHEDAPGHWTPLTPGAKIYDLLNDVNSEGFNCWTSITIT